MKYWAQMADFPPQWGETCKTFPNVPSPQTPHILPSGQRSLHFSVTQIPEIPQTHTHNHMTLTNAVQKSTQEKDKCISRKTRCRSKMKDSNTVQTLLLNVKCYNLFNNCVSLRNQMHSIIFASLFLTIIWLRPSFSLRVKTLVSCRHYLH